MKNDVNNNSDVIVTSDKIYYGYNLQPTHALRNKSIKKILKLYDDGYSPHEIASLIGMVAKDVRLAIISEIIRAV